MTIYYCIREDRASAFCFRLFRFRRTYFSRRFVSALVSDHFTTVIEI